jgi:hypothetical protein
MADETENKINIGSNTLQKGEVRDGMQLVAWDCIQECHPEECPIGRSCLYSSESLASSDGQCSLQRQYLQSFVDVILRTYRYIDEGDMFRIGMHLVPLYSQLCRLKIVEKSVVNVTFIDHKGVTRIHPIFREMRDTMKTITSLWREMGFQNTVNPSMPGEDVNKYRGRSGYGDPDHYERISQNSDNKRGTIR